MSLFHVELRKSSIFVMSELLINGSFPIYECSEM